MDMHLKLTVPDPKLLAYTTFSRESILIMKQSFTAVSLTNPPQIVPVT